MSKWGVNDDGGASAGYTLALNEAALTLEQDRLAHASTPLSMTRDATLSYVGRRVLLPINTLRLSDFRSEAPNGEILIVLPFFGWHREIVRLSGVEAWR